MVVLHVRGIARDATASARSDPDLVYVSDHDPELSAVTRKQVLGQLADRGTDVIVGHFHGPGRFNRSGAGFSWSSLAEEGEAAVE